LERFQKETYFPEATSGPMQLLIGVCGPVTIPAGKIPYRIGQEFTVASVEAPPSRRSRFRDPPRSRSGIHPILISAFLSQGF